MSVAIRFSRRSFRLVALVATLAILAFGAGVARPSGDPICTASLGALSCGDADNDGSVTSSDALLALQAGIGAIYCDDCLCDASGASSVTATDALMLLQIAVGSAIPVDCKVCDASVCGDSTLTPFRGAPLGASVLVVDWCLLLDADPDDVERDITVTITKALDTYTAPVEDIEVSIIDHGCDCGFLRADASPDGLATTTPAIGAVTTSTLGFCNCMVGVRAEASVPLALIEAHIDLYDGDCGDFVGSGTVLVDGGVEEECDDGNQTPGDGCSAECRIETSAPAVSE